MSKTFEEVMADVQVLQDTLDQTQQKIADGFAKLQKEISDLRAGGGANADQLEALDNKLAEIKSDLISTPVPDVPDDTQS